MYVAGIGCIKDLPREFHHDIHIRDINGRTVYNILEYYGLYIPDEWRIKLNLFVTETTEGTECCVCMEKNIKLQLKMKCSDKHSIC